MDKLKAYLLRHKTELDIDSPPADTWESIASKMSDEPPPTGITIASGIPATSGRLVRPGFPSRLLRYAIAACVIALAGAGLWLITRNHDKVSPDTARKNNGTIKSEPAHAAAKPGDTLRKEEETAVTEKVPGRAKPGRARRKGGPPKTKESDEVANIDKNYSRLIDFELKKLRTTPLYAENGSYFSFYTEQLKQMDRDEQAVRNDIKTYGLTSEILDQLINVYQQKLNLLKNLQTEVNKMNNKVREKQGPSQKPEIHYLNI